MYQMRLNNLQYNTVPSKLETVGLESARAAAAFRSQALQISASVVRQGGKHYSESHSDTCSDTDEESCGPSDSESDGN